MNPAFIKGTIFGATVAAAALTGYAFGTSSHGGDSYPEYNDREEQVLEAGRCRVDVGYGRTTPGSRCYSGEVMVGTRSGYLLCADITVTCD